MRTVQPPSGARPASAEEPRSSLGAWREVQAAGALPDDADPDRTAAGLVSRWHQHLAVAMDVALEQGAPGPERLAELVQAWLDLARRTVRVRDHVAVTTGPLADAQAARHQAALVELLAEDLAAVGAPSPRRSAQDLLRELEQVAAAEDRAGRVLPRQRAGLLGSPASRRCYRPTRLRRSGRLIATG